MNSSWTKARRLIRIKTYDDVRQKPDDQVQIPMKFISRRRDGMKAQYQEYPTDEEIKKYGLEIIGKVTSEGDK